MTELRPKVELVSTQIMQRLNTLFEKLKLRQNFAIDPERAQAYYQLDRSRELLTGRHRDIPIGNSETVRYNHEHPGHITDRPMSSYLESLFPDEYMQEEHETRDQRLTEAYGEGWSWRRHLAPAIRREDLSQVVNGGTETAFGSGKLVVNLGSDEAIGDMQLSQAHPETTFLAIDTGYNTKKPPELNKPGLQLVKGDWATLSTIPDNSVDAILSLQGAFTWGYRTNEEANTLIDTVTRIAKPNAILRFDIGSFRVGQSLTKESIFELFQSKGWEITSIENTAIARKLE